MISVISVTADDPILQKCLMAEYLPEDKTLILSIDGNEQLYTFTITESETAITMGKFLCECGIDIEELEDELDSLLTDLQVYLRHWGVEPPWVALAYLIPKASH